MPEQTPQNATPTVVPESPETPKVSRIRSFANNHPRIARVAQLTAAVAGTALVVSTAKNMQANRKAVTEAGDHAKEALHALSDSTQTPEPQEN